MTAAPVTGYEIILPRLRPDAPSGHHATFNGKKLLSIYTREKEILLYSQIEEKH